MSRTHLRYETKDGVGRITLGRPDVLNSFNTAMARELHVEGAGTLKKQDLIFAILTARSRVAEEKKEEMEVGHAHKLIGMHMLEMGLLSTSQLIEILKYYEDR